MRICGWHLCHKETDSNFCSKQCKSKYFVSKRRSAAQRAACLYKGNKCLVCGYQGPSVVYDFHHLDPKEKDFGISSRWTKSWDSLRKELDKCVMLCPICHRLHHGGLLDLTPYLSKCTGTEEVSGVTLPSVQRVPKESRMCEICGSIKRICSSRCKLCAAKSSPTKIDWPTTEVILSRLENQSFESLARDLGVSSNSIRKRLKTRSSTN